MTAANRDHRPCGMALLRAAPSQRAHCPRQPAARRPGAGTGPGAVRSGRLRGSAAWPPDSAQCGSSLGQHCRRGAAPLSGWGVCGTVGHSTAPLASAHQRLLAPSSDDQNCLLGLLPPVENHWIQGARPRAHTGPGQWHQFRAWTEGPRQGQEGTSPSAERGQRALGRVRRAQARRVLLSPPN